MRPATVKVMLLILAMDYFGGDCDASVTGLGAKRGDQALASVFIANVLFEADVKGQSTVEAMAGL